jgi:ribosome biogenesis protein NSA1
MDLITGDETGLLKYVGLRSKRDIVTYGEQARELAFKGLTWADDTSKQFISIRMNESLDLWSIDNGEIYLNESLQLKSLKNPAGIDRFPGDSNSPVICYGADGDISVVQLALNGNVGEKAKELSSFGVKGPLSALQALSDGFASGGRENDVSIYDLTTQQATWNAKNVPHDKLNLRVPVWISAITSLKPPAATTSSDCRFATGTGYRHVRVYDAKTSRQPVLSFEPSEYPITALAAVVEGDAAHMLYVADAAGGLALWDLRTQRKLHTLKGSSGSIRHLTMSSSGIQ